jgi:crossover junction endodeoxyribonuclease RuvC
MTFMKKKIILGIDPGSNITGYGLIADDGHRQEAIDFGCIRPPKHLTVHEKYLFIFNGVDYLLEKYTPDAIAIETQFMSKNAQSAMKLGRAQGSALLAASRRNIPIFEYAPKKAKLAVVGNGSASKEQVQKMIQLLLKLPQLPEPEDAADALALALCHTPSYPLNKLCTNTSKAR